MFGKLNSESINNGLNKAKHFSVHHYTHGQHLLHNIDHGMRVAREVYGAIAPALQALSGNEPFKTTNRRAMDAVSIYKNIRQNVIRCVSDNNAIVTPTAIFYSRIPTPVRWGYVVVSEKALYDPTLGRTIHFELHRSEESELVYKILKFAGVAMQRIDIMRAGQIQEQHQQQQEKL